VFGRFILYSMILPLVDLIILCVYNGWGLGLSIGLDGRVVCGFTFGGTLDRGRLAPFCPL